MISFGRKALQAGSIAAFLDLEHKEDRSSGFNTVDALVGTLLVRSFQGERVVKMISRQEHGYSVVVNGLSTKQRAFVEDTYRLDHQQSRGAWFLPTEVSLRTGTINFPANVQQFPRFANSITLDEHGKVTLANDADALLAWALLEPLFDALFEPFTLRGRLAGSTSQEDQLKSWYAIDALFDALGLEISDELAVMRYGGGWHKLQSQEQVAAKQRLLAALARHIEPATATRYRAYCFRSLLKYYYKKADRDGRVKRKQALTKSLEPSIAGYFGGDWLAFLEYIGEEPHPDEQIVTALPKTRLHVSGVSRAAEVADRMGVPVAEVERMMAAYWQQADGVSPVEQRVDFLRRYWVIFDEIHARQAVGMQSLWGLVEDHRPFDFYYHDPNLPYQPRLYLQLLPRAVLAEIERLWGTMMLPRWPDRILSEPSPHMALAETMGPALKFWHETALTAWFLCEGPSSRTNMVGLAEHQRREIKALKELGTPLDSQLFDELVKAEKNLGPSQPLTQNSSTGTGKSGISITITTSSGARREGFERLRDIITLYRRVWAEKHLNHYLHTRWETEIREAGRVYNHLLSEMSKAPTAKQFAKVAALATNHWFGGDLSGLYGAIREKSPVQPQQCKILPTDGVAFAFSVFQALGGNPYFRQEHPHGSGQNYQAWRQEWDRNAQLSELAGLSFWYIQLEEGLGHPPDMKEFGQSKFTQLCTVVSGEADKAWHMYTEVIEAAKRSRVPTTPMDQALGHHAEPQSNSDFVSSQQLLGGAPITKNQPPEQKRSWFDRLFRRD
ncbi:MAG: hypothetical protein ACJ8AG_14515 [Ktedonobacteraceae bacterium]